MKKYAGMISVFLFLAAVALPAVGSDRYDGNHGYTGYQSPRYDYGQGNNHPSGRDHDGKAHKDNRRHYKKDDRHDRGYHYEYRYHDSPYKGYRSQPHGRYYHKPHRYHDHDYHYEGHWNSWNDWERYHKIYPKRFHHGRYYHDDDGHLFFRFCDPDGSACLFYSIGR